MTLSRAIKSIANWWNARCREKRLERANPRLRFLRLQEQDAKRRHRPVRPIRAERQAVINAMLKGGA